VTFGYECGKSLQIANTPSRIRTGDLLRERQAS
jgi:hypothetical protein